VASTGGRSASNRLYDALVIGGGPAGSATAYWLASAGWDVAVVEKKHFPRAKTCGDGLTPRSVRQLLDMGLGDALSGAHRYLGLRACAFGSMLELPWPRHPDFPEYGYTITRHDLDALVAEHAAKAGATIFEGTEALEPLDPTPGDDGQAGASRHSLAGCAGARVRTAPSGGLRDLRARYVVVADGANSRFGRALGTTRNRAYPQGMALRGYFYSDRHDDPWIESHLDIRDGTGKVVPGYGWVFPLGDGRVNVGVGLLSTERRWKGANTSKLMDAFIDWAPRSWGITRQSMCAPPTGGRLPMGLAVGPRIGPNTLVVGDAAGLINPFNGEGIAYGYESGRLAAAAVHAALEGSNPAALACYERDLNEAYGDYYRVARAFVRLISHPRTMRASVGTTIHSKWFMSELLRIMGNLMLPGPGGAAERTYRGMVAAAKYKDGALARLTTEVRRLGLGRCPVALQRPGGGAPDHPATTSAAASPAAETTKASSSGPCANPGKRTS